MRGLQVPLILEDSAHEAWITLAVDLRSILGSCTQVPFKCLRGFQICANLIVRGLYTSDIQMRPEVRRQSLSSMREESALTTVATEGYGVLDGTRPVPLQNDMGSEGAGGGNSGKGRSVPARSRIEFSPATSGFRTHAPRPPIEDGNETAALSACRKPERLREGVARSGIAHCEAGPLFCQWLHRRVHEHAFTGAELGRSPLRRRLPSRCHEQYQTSIRRAQSQRVACCRSEATAFFHWALCADLLLVDGQRGEAASLRTGGDTSADSFVGRTDWQLPRLSQRAPFRARMPGSVPRRSEINRRGARRTETAGSESMERSPRSWIFSGRDRGVALRQFGKHQVHSMESV